MKTFKIIPILIVVAGVAFYKIDKRLYYYGKNDLSVYHLLPFKTVPDYRTPFEGGFALRDEYGLAIAGHGVVPILNNKKIRIDRVLKYGFDKEHLIALIVDCNRTKHYIKFEPDQKDQSVIIPTVQTGNEILNTKALTWINIADSEDYIWELNLRRNYLQLFIAILFMILIYGFFRYKKSKKSDSKTIERS